MVVGAGRRVAGAALLGAAAAGLLAACAGRASTAAPAAVQAATQQARAPVTAGDVVERLRREGQPISTVRRYDTAEADPTHQLGRQGLYRSKADFTDARLAGAVHDVEGRANSSGSVEVFTSEAEAQVRKAYVRFFLDNNAFFHEREVVAGPVLLRLSPRFTSRQAAGYASALRRAVAVT
jgi:hypothetical protein